ncbi:MAG: hypothetical protein CTY16_12790 [Methylobacter sp.]|nr:MAG: hypothetical protein CTY16_12790 [Methylobacter sp.]
MKINIYTENFDIQVRLAQLNLTESALIEAVKIGQLARTKLTSNHPRIFHGYSAWAETVARLREVLLPLGWEKSDKGNYELVTNELLELAIAVATGNEFTGFPHATPSNKCPKGMNTIEAINTNNQMDLIQEFVELIPLESSVNKDSYSTWILLYHFAKDEIRCELSLPSEIDTDGRIIGWKERIILNSIPLGETPIEVRPTENQDINIEIRRKAS